MGERDHATKKFSDLNQSEAVDYLKLKKIDNLLSEYKTCLKGVGSIIEPDYIDLVRLHRYIIDKGINTVLEFGSGYSTIVILDALEFNWRENVGRSETRPWMGPRFASVETSRTWADILIKFLQKKALNSDRVEILQTDAKIGMFNGQLCHFYKKLPNIVPDLIYLDGPNPRDVVGEINGMNFFDGTRTVMAADLLIMEPTFLPGLRILIDGRVNNARFLERNLKRSYEVTWDCEGDVTYMLLDEPPLSI